MLCPSTHLDDNEFVEKTKYINTILHLNIDAAETISKEVTLE